MSQCYSWDSYTFVSHKIGIIINSVFASSPPKIDIILYIALLRVLLLGVWKG